jgi:hypothetical protein
MKNRQIFVKIDETHTTRFLSNKIDPSENSSPTSKAKKKLPEITPNTFIEELRWVFMVNLMMGWCPITESSYRQ